MSFEAMAWAHAQKVPDVECKMLLLMLANRSALHETDSNICWPSIAQLSDDCLLSATTIRERLRVLSGLGLILVTPRHAQNGDFTSHLFKLRIPHNWLLRAAREGTTPGDGPGTTPGEVETVSTETVSETGTHELALGVPAKTGKTEVLRLRVGALFGRKANTKWSAKELKALKAIDQPEESDMLKLEKYYAARIVNRDKDYRKRKLITLLNDFSGELDVARNFKEQSCL